MRPVKTFWLKSSFIMPALKHTLTKTTMKLNNLTVKQVIHYLPKKEIARLMPIADYRSVSQVLSDPKQTAFFKSQLKRPDSPMAKAVRQGTRTHRALETGIAKSEFDHQCLETFHASIGIDLEEVWGQEEWVAHPYQYKGKFDGVGIYKGKLTLFDHKKTNKRKTKSGLTGYFKQLAAYKQAHEHIYRLWPIEQLAIFNIYGTTAETLGAEATVLTEDEMSLYTTAFNTRVKSM